SEYGLTQQLGNILFWVKNCNEFSFHSGIVGLGLEVLYELKFNHLDILYKEILDLIYFRIKYSISNDNIVENNGIYDGKLGIVLFLVEYYKLTKDDIILLEVKRLFTEASHAIVQKENYIEFVNSFSDSISTPYVNDGLSGYVLLSLQLWELTGDENYFKKEYIRFLTNISFCKRRDLFSGQLGISYVLYKVSQSNFSTIQELNLTNKAMRQLSNSSIFELREKNRLHIYDYYPNNEERDVTHEYQFMFNLFLTHQEV
ncbi:lanthionine synthetase LanC family protein, partial [Streptococcus vestibularis]|uniref:lanthionine synthetase LanC family protein n=1 Tax=Streptococcus vestibularis TaxID=1343 RepID=UPI003AB77F4F